MLKKFAILCSRTFRSHFTAKRMESSSFTGKRALVTGGNEGIGLEIARSLYKKGAKVAIIGRNKVLLANAAKEMPGLEALCVNLSDWKSTAEIVKGILPVQLLVNNAGVSVTKPFGQFEENDFDKVYSVNVKAIINVSQIITNDLRSRSLPGSIVNISSIASLRPLLDHAIYCSSKSAVDSLTGVMALELGPHKIRVNSINPVLTMTEMAMAHWTDPQKVAQLMARIPLGKFTETSDIANATLFLLSDESSQLTGVILPVDGGYTRV